MKRICASCEGQLKKYSLIGNYIYNDDNEIDFQYKIVETEKQNLKTIMFCFPQWKFCDGFPPEIAI